MFRNRRVHIRLCIEFVQVQEDRYGCKSRGVPGLCSVANRKPLKTDGRE